MSFIILGFPELILEYGETGYRAVLHKFLYFGTKAQPWKCICNCSVHFFKKVKCKIKTKLETQTCSQNHSQKF